MRRVLLFGALLSLAAGTQLVAAAQVTTYPTRYPEASAAGREWYTAKEPLFFGGILYYPAGAERHFDGNVMVQTGTFEGVPLFADTSVEPYSEILVPIGRGLVQPYERRREGDVAGTTGSRAPSFPVRSAAEEGVAPGQPWPGGSSQSAPARATAPQQPAPAAEQAEAPGRVVTARPPRDNRGIWIRYEGSRWESAGEAVERDASFTRVGDYRGFPVYTRAGVSQPAQEIYIPSRDDMLAPYRKAS